MRALCCIAGGLASAARNATKIAGDMASEAQQFSKASSNIPTDVQSAVSSYINMVKAKLETIAQNIEQCVRNYPPS